MGGGGGLDFTYLITNIFYFMYLNQLNLIIFVDLKVFNCLCKSAIVFVYFDMMLTSHNIFCSLLPKMSFLSSVNKKIMKSLVYFSDNITCVTVNQSRCNSMSYL